MPDSYLDISAIAVDGAMIERMNAAAAQQAHLGGLSLNTWSWVSENRYLWASSPSWGEKWRYALDTHPNDPNYQPGRDEAVITDGDILATVQALMVEPETPVP